MYLLIIFLLSGGQISDQAVFMTKDEQACLKALPMAQAEAEKRGSYVAICAPIQHRTM